MTANIVSTAQWRYNKHMTLRAYLMIMTIATLIFWLAFGLVIISVDPSSGWLSLGLFYVLLLFALTGTGSILGFIIRFLALKQELVARSVVVAFRQALLMGILITVILFLFSQKLFSWLNLGLLILALSALEFFLLSYESERLNGADSEE